MSDKTKIGILISGRGSNMMTLADEMDKGNINGTIEVVISNEGDAPGLEKAQNRGLETLYIDHRDFESREKFDREVVGELQDRDVEIVCLAGFMRLLSPYFVEEYRNRIMNIHPSLLPAFTGLDAQKQAFEYGVKVSGCTVHFVDEQLDHGPIILQKTVPVKEDDTVETLSDRILKQEHIAYPEALSLYCDGKLSVEDRKVKIED